MCAFKCVLVLKKALTAETVTEAGIMHARRRGHIKRMPRELTHSHLKRSAQKAYLEAVAA